MKRKLKKYIESSNTIEKPPTEVSVKIKGNKVNKIMYVW